MFNFACQESSSCISFVDLGKSDNHFKVCACLDSFPVSAFIIPQVACWCLLASEVQRACILFFFSICRVTIREVTSFQFIYLYRVVDLTTDSTISNQTRASWVEVEKDANLYWSFGKKSTLVWQMFFSISVLQELPSRKGLIKISRVFKSSKRKYWQR